MTAAPRCRYLIFCGAQHQTLLYRTHSSPSYIAQCCYLLYVISEPSRPWRSLLYSQQNRSILGLPTSCHQPLAASAPLQRPHDAFPPLLSHQPSCIAAGLRCRSFHLSNLRTLPAASSLHSPSFRPFPLRAILLFPQALLLYPCYSPHRSSQPC